MPFAFLLALQASGMVIDWFGKRNQIELSRMGAKIEQAGIESNIYSARLEAEDAATQSMKQLRQNLGTQLAFAAAKGAGKGTTSTILLSNESVGNFNADQRIRRINLMGKEANLRAGQVLSKLHETSYENNIWNEFRQSAINKVGTLGFGGSGSSSAFSGSKAGGFGLTKVGG